MGLDFCFGEFQVIVGALAGLVDQSIDLWFVQQTRV